MFGSKLGGATGAAATPAFGAQPTAGGTSGFNFGNATQTPTPAFGVAPAQGTGLSVGNKGFGFGQAPQTNPKTPAQGGAAAPLSFGGAAQGSTSLFGSQPAATGLGGLGAQQQKPANAFGAATPATAATGSSPEVTKTTRYGEVPDQMRSQLDELEQFIESQKQAVEEVKSTTTYQEILQIHVITEQINLKSHGLKNLLDRDETVIKELRSLMNEETKIADGASRFIDRYNNPHYTFQQHANDPTSKDYFSNVTDQLERRLQIYRQTIDDLERHFQTITQKPHYTPQAIADILRSQHESFMSIAGKIALVHDGITKEKERFLMYRNKYFGDNRNPFKDGAASAAKETPLSAIAAELQPSANAQQPAQQGQMGQTGQTGQMGTMGGFGGVGGFGASTAPSTGFGTSGFSFGKK